MQASVIFGMFFVLVLLGGTTVAVLYLTKVIKFGKEKTADPKPDAIDVGKAKGDPCLQKLPKGKWKTYEADPTLCVTSGDTTTWPGTCCNDKSTYKCTARYMQADSQIVRCHRVLFKTRARSQMNTKTHLNWKGPWVCDMN